MQAPPAVGLDPEAGMTLVEIVVALAIVAVMASITVLSIGAADRGGGAETEARRLAARIGLAADEALIEGRSVMLAWDERGYSLTGDGVPTDGLTASSERHDLGANLKLSGPAARGSVMISESGDGRPVAFLISDSDREWRVDFNGLDASAARIQP